MVLIRIRRGLHRFWSVLDSEGVGIFQAIVYVHVVLGGFYGALVARETPQAVEESMGHVFAQIWLGLSIGAVMCLLGRWLMKHAPNVGIWLQLTGDLFVLGTFSAYVIATLDTSWWGRALFAVFIIIGLIECVLLLVIRDIRRIIQIERIIRQ